MSVSEDRGLLLGDGLFETLLWRNGRLLEFDEHVARMARGCAAIGVPAPTAAALRSAAEVAVRDAGLTGARAAVRLTWTAGAGGRGLDRPAEPRPLLHASAAPAPAVQGPARLVTASVRRNEGSPASRLKSLAYLDSVLARREAAAAGAEEALMLNNRGEVACAAAANLFWFEGERLATPAIDCGVLDGVVRGRILAAAADRGLDCEEVRADPRRLSRARGLFLTNSLIRVRPVAAVDGSPVEPHPAVRTLADAVA